MGKYAIHIQVENFQDVEKELQELAYIMTGLREAQIKWDEHFGANNLKNKKYWQAKADQWIDKHKIKVDE